MGGSGGAQFYYGLEEEKCPQYGTVVRSLRVWFDKDKSGWMDALEVGLSDGKIHLFGIQKNQVSDSFIIADGERIVSLKVWGSNYGDDGRNGGFELTTDQKRTFSINAGQDGDPYQPEIGSGILVGVYGSVGSDIDCLGFALLRRAKAQLIGVEYPGISTLLITTQPTEIRTITYDNSKGKVEQEFTFEGSKKVTTTESWSVTAGMEASISVEVKAGFPLIAQTKVTTSLKVSVSGTYGRTNSETKDRSFSFPLKIPAGQRLQATAIFYEGNINTKYTATMVYYLDSGAKFYYNVSGEYSGISASQVNVTLTPFIQYKPQRVL